MAFMGTLDRTLKDKSLFEDFRCSISHPYAKTDTDIRGFADEESLSFHIIS